VALIWSLLAFESWCRVCGMFGGDLRAAGSVSSSDDHTLAAASPHGVENAAQSPAMGQPIESASP
jgi:hypothetical protein